MGDFTKLSLMQHIYAVGHRFSGPEVDLVVDRLAPADPAPGWLPAYELRVTLADRDEEIGSLRARLGYSNALVLYNGHIGYDIQPEFQGHHYAAKACSLTRELFRAHGMDVIWITCNPDNFASRRTCELLGCTYIETVELPPGSHMYVRGERQKRRYRWLVYNGA